MDSYLLHELLPQVWAQGWAQSPAQPARTWIFGHSMGGQGALTLALRYPGVFGSLSALAPISAPMSCPWGQKAFSGYLGDDRSAWAPHDASALMAAMAAAPYPSGILIDQGGADKFLAEQLHPEAFEAACAAVGQPLTLRRHADTTTATTSSPAWSTTTCATTPGSLAADLPCAGHLVAWRRPRYWGSRA